MQIIFSLMSITKHDEWLGVEVRHFAALQAVASERSFGRAARRLGYTQSAVSQQVATLERIVGEQLVERPGGPRPVSLTEAGALLLRHADSIVARLQAAQSDLEALKAGEAGTLRVGTFQSVGTRLLPEIMRRFTAQWPAIDVMLEEHDDAEIAAALERGELDVGFVVLPVGDAPLEAIEIVRDGYALVVPAGSALAQGFPALRDVAQQPLVGFRPSGATETVEAAIRAVGVEPRFAFRSNDNGIVQGLVAAGVGPAILPRLTVDASDPRIVLREVEPPIAPRVIAVARHRDRYASPAMRAFVETVLSVTRR